MKYVFFLLLTCLWFASCQEEAKITDIYLDYKIWCDEGDDDVTVLLQVRNRNARGFTRLLEEPARLELDGIKLTPDSSGKSGFFYETQVAMAEFIGKHELVYVDPEGREFSEEFQFQPMELRTELPASIGRDDYSIQLQGLDKRDYVRIVMNDTSVRNDGINRLDTVQDGRLTLRKSDLEALMPGPIHLVLIRENEKELSDPPGRGGRISLTYGLRRDFFLRR